MVVGRLLSYWEGNFSGAMLASGRVSLHHLRCKKLVNNGRNYQPQLCQGLNSHYFHIIGDKVINPIIGFYIPIIRIPIKGGIFTIPNIATTLTMAQLVIAGFLNHQSYYPHLLPETRNNHSFLLGCPRKLGSMVRINGLFHLLINGYYPHNRIPWFMSALRV